MQNARHSLSSSRRRTPLAASIATLFTLALGSVAPLSAAALTWNGTGTNGTGDGAGTWLNPSQWWDGAANVGWNNGIPDDAVFGNGGAGGIITLGTVTAGSLTFNSFSGTYTLSAGSLALNSGITMNSGSGAVTSSSPLTIGGTQNWTNNTGSLLTISGSIAYNNAVTFNGTGSVRLNNQTNTGTGGLTLSSGKLLVGTSNAVNLIAGAASSVLTLSGGTVATTAAGSGGDRVFGNNLLANGTVQFGDGNFAGGAMTFQGATQTFNGAVFSARDNNGISFTTGSAVMTGNITINSPSAGTITGFTFSGGFTVSGAASANQTFANNTILAASASGATISGAIVGTAASQTLTLGGSGQTTIGNITSGANNPGLIVNGTSTGVFIFNTANAFGGGVTLTGGITEIGADSGGITGTNGPLGTGTVTMNGGTIRPGSGNDRTISNLLNIIGGNNTFASSPASGRIQTFTGNVTVSGTPTLTFNNTNVTAFTTGTFTLNSDATFAGTGNYGIRNGLIWTAPRILTITNTGQGIFRGALNGGANTLTFSGTALAGTGSNVIFGDGTAPIITGASSGVIVNGPTVSFATTTSTFTGGVTATSGITRIGSNSVVTTGALVSGPFGVGTFTINGGTITGNSGTARIINNNIAIIGDSTFGVIGDATNTATLTFDPSTVTTPSAGTFTLSGARTLTVNVGTTFTGPIGGSTSLAVKGISTLSLINASGTSSSFGSLTVGDTVATGSVGGTVVLGNSSAANQQNALGAGAITINYGGTLQSTTTTFNPANSITVNNGGTLNLFGGASPSGTIIYNSGARIATASGNTTLPSGVTLPSAGVLLFNTGNAVSFASGNYPSLTGTIAFGGSLGAAFNAGTTTLSNATNTARTIAFDAINNGGAATFTGIALNANLTVAGTGNNGLTGLVPSNVGGNLGTITEDATPRSITVNLAPTGAVRVTPTATGWTGGTTANGGTLIAAAPSGSSSSKRFGSAGVTLNGGGVRVYGFNNTDTVTVQDTFTVRAGGGWLESGTTSGTVGTVYSGNISDFSGSETGAVILRPGFMSGGSGSLLTLSGDNTGFTGGFRLAHYTGSASVRFSGANSLGAPTNTINAPAGVTFGFTGFTPSSAQMNQFTTTSESILALDGFASIDLSSGGYNKDLRLGNFGMAGGTVALSFGGAITPNASTYKFTASSLAGFTLTGVNQLTDAAGPVARNLDVSAPAVASGSSSITAGTFAIAAANNYTGTTLVSGTVGNSLTGGGQTGITLQINTGGNISGSTAFTVERGATLAVAGTTGTITSTNPSFTIRGGSTLRIGSTNAADNNASPNRITDTVAITLGSVSGSTFQGGGTLSMAYGSVGAVTETLGSLAVGVGDNTLGTSNTVAGNLALTFGGAAASNYTRIAGGTVNISTAAGFTVNFTNAPTSNVSGAGANEILVGAYLNNAGFARVNAGVVGAATYTVQNAAGSWSAGQNIDATGAVTGTTTAGTANINSLRATNGGTITIGTVAGDTLSLASGMVLLNGNGLTINGPGSLTTGNGQDFILFFSGGNFTIASRILGGVPLTVVGTGSGNLHLQSTANAFTGINANGATRVLIEDAGAWGNAGAINLANGAVFGYNITAADKTLSSGYTINIGSTGAAFIQGSTGTLTVQGAVTLNGTMSTATSNGTIVPNGTVDYQGNISGAGSIAVGFGNRARYLLSGTDNSGWTGGLSTTSVTGSGSGSANIFGFNANSFGLNAINASPILLGRTANLYFDTNAAGAVTMNQAIAFNANSTISFWGRGSGLSATGSGGAGTATLTWAGQILGSAGATFQGTATAANQVSELVLKNTFSTSGTPTTYNWSATATTAIQNFVNGQGGIQLGVTGFNGTAANTTTTRVEDGSGAASAVVNGALGFVRFDGANSFIPGAVGPGYISALHKGSDAATYGNGALTVAAVGSTGGANGLFGYLLTGGSTYALPEGKSFVIGSLGSGTQIGGTLGSSGTGTAILTGSAKLAGFGAGDINVHANAVGDTQQLNLLARNSGDTLQLGTSGGSGVVFTSSFGDSGAASSITLMADRTGLTTLNKIGAGVLTLANVSYLRVDGVTTNLGTTGFGWNLKLGTLNINTATALAGGTFAIGDTTGSSAVTINNTSAGALTLSTNNVQMWNQDFTFTGTQDLNLGTGAVTLSATRQVTTTAGTLTVGGNIGGGAVGITKAGGGTLSLSGSSSYTDVTTVSGGKLEVKGSLSGTTGVTVNTGGTLLLNSASNNIVNSSTPAPLTVDGGKVAIDNSRSVNTQTFGPLTLKDNSTLDFGSSDSNKFVFGSLATLGTTNIQILNWTGTPYPFGANTDNGAPATQDRLLFTDPLAGSGYADGQLLPQISFFSDGGSTPLGAGQAISFTGGGANWEIVPVPEPATTALFGSVALCALIGYRKPRRVVRGTHGPSAL